MGSENGLSIDGLELTYTEAVHLERMLTQARLVIWEQKKARLQAVAPNESVNLHEQVFNAETSEVLPHGVINVLLIKLDKWMKAMEAAVQSGDKVAVEQVMRLGDNMPYEYRIASGPTEGDEVMKCDLCGDPILVEFIMELNSIPYCMTCAEESGFVYRDFVAEPVKDEVEDEAVDD